MVQENIHAAEFSHFVTESIVTQTHLHLIELI